MGREGGEGGVCFTCLDTSTLLYVNYRNGFNFDACPTV